MKIKFESRFEKDLQKIKNKELFQKIKEIIEKIKESADPFSMQNLKKIKGYDTFYRIRTGSYRIGIETIDNEVIFTRVLHRKDVYKFFP